MQEYLGQIRSIQEEFEVFDLSHVPRSGNIHADSLATLATSSAQDLPRVVLVEDLSSNASGCSTDTSDYAGSKLDGCCITVLGKRCTA